ncbi:MAG: hypothetical protein WBE86_01815 [Candidatus Acidiferrales bacterium]
MKLVTTTFATAVLLALAGVAPSAHVQAQDQKQQQDKTPAKPQKPPQQQQKPAHPQTSRPAQHPQQPKQQAHQQKQQKQQQQKTEQKQQRAQQQQQKPASRQQPARTERAQHAAPAHGQQRARGNAQQVAHYEQAHLRRYQPRPNEHVVRIPDTQFSAHFGQGHRFHMGRPVIVGGFPRFQYSGFWFVLEEPWPNYWYDSDDFYVTFDGGLYWLCDYNDPGVQIQLVVVTG